MHDGTFFADHVRLGTPKAPQELRLVTSSRLKPREAATSPDSAATILRSFWLLDGISAACMPRHSPKRKQSAATPELAQAIAHKWLAPLRAWLTEGHDPNARDSSGRSLLHLASAAGFADGVELLVGVGADVDVQQTHQCTPLYFASMVGDATVVAALLAADANPNLADCQGITALMQAARRNHIAVVKVLLDRGARTDVRDVNGDSVCSHARSHEPSSGRFVLAALRRHKGNAKKTKGGVSAALQGLQRPREPAHLPASQRLFSLERNVLAPATAEKRGENN